ncbi:threonine--tRNA ligase [Pontibacillus litoralis]|uniref:Threonine--tRNA ligase n=1 Tax=Pontibacillus litoralis JSM 072002 TaxID=1385512 RepID=A0A0A5FVR4_9BACI|nr:threonine--tRNA ligase [Pontibacillus litoralis]KGX84891.1 threonyl-tRNA synthetase [Pontibacillus litoralis JSM 072002]
MEKEIVITFPNGEAKPYACGVRLLDIAESISPTLRKKSVVGKVNGHLYDMRRCVKENANLELYDLSSSTGLEVMKETAAYVLAQALHRLNGEVQLGKGCITDNGFYYDVKAAYPITSADLSTIENEMNHIIQENRPITHEIVSKEEAIRLFASNPLKLDWLESFAANSEEVLIYRQGNFTDIVNRPLLPSLKDVRAFALMNIAGAYWQGDSNNQMLERIYGVAFASKEEKVEYFHFIEEAKARNHLKLGKELALFMFSEEAPGMPFYLPNGHHIRNELESFLRHLQHTYHYQEVHTPTMMNQRLWEKSGHWHHYQENMYFSHKDNQQLALKPMNCPGHMLLFKHTLRSYRDLPIRISEFGHVHRHEYSGALNGLLRVRSFCQDDAHLFVTYQQIEEEIKAVLHLIDHVYQTFGFPYTIELSTRPEQSMGDDALWNQAEQSLQNVLEDLGYPYTVNEGDGAFYGPKIDIHIEDALKRKHQCGTVQLDFQMPEKFDLSYVNEHGEYSRPVVIHRAIYGSIDRFLAILIEHFAGAFPVWLAPIQAAVLPVSNLVHKQAVLQIIHRLKQEGIRVEGDIRDEKLGYKIRQAQKKKIPYMIVIGDHEVENETINVRRYGEKDSYNIELEHFMNDVKQLIKERTL